MRKKIISVLVVVVLLISNCMANNRFEESTKIAANFLFSLKKEEIDNFIKEIKNKPTTRVYFDTNKLPNLQEFLIFLNNYKYVFVVYTNDDSFCLGFNSIKEIKKLRKLL